MTDAIGFDTISADVPMLLVPATAGDGEPLTVVVDTGATPPFPLIVSEALAKRLGLSLEAGETAAGARTTAPNPSQDAGTAFHHGTDQPFRRARHRHRSG